MQPDILTAMLTPVVLISACASLLISTSNRLGRVVDDVRRLSERIQEHVETPSESQSESVQQRKRTLLRNQLGYMVRRARLLQISLATQYAAVAAFVLTSVILGLFAWFHHSNITVAAGIGFVGMVLLFVSSTYMTLEARLAVHTTTYEMSWLREILEEKEIASATGETADGF